MTLNERIREDACIYEAEFPPSVPEGRPLSDARPRAQRGGMLRRWLAQLKRPR